MTIVLIIMNALIFLFEMSLGRHINEFFNYFAILPAKYFFLASKVGFTIIERFYPLLTSQFLHGGWLHIIGNMWFLWIFGDNIEDRLGHFKFLLFYLLCGFAAGLTHVYTNPSSDVPTIGASGAVAGVMGAYIILYPRAKVLTLIPIFFFIQFVEIPAFIFLGVWFLIQFLSGAFVLAANEVYTGVAWWAHIGGFVIGAVLVIFLPKKKQHDWFSD